MGRGLMAVLGLSVLVLGLIAWYLVHGHTAEKSRVTPGVSAPAVPAAVAGSETTPAAVVRAKKPSAVVEAGSAGRDTPVAAAGPSAVAGGAVQWRVVAFTYNHEDQAQAKAARVREQHPELRPEVFTPSGGAPYLVTIGGAMGRDDAYALARKAREKGLPRDSYAQNYRSGAVGR